MHIGKRKVNGGNVECLPADPQDKGGAFNGHANGTGNADIDRGLGLASGEDIRTYKRRKKLRLSSERRLQDGLIPSEAAGQLADEIVRNPQEIVLYHNSDDQEGVTGIDCPVLLEGSDDCPREHWRNVVLKHISQSLDVGEGGIQSCIQDALASSRFGFNAMFKTNGASEQTVDAQESVHCHNLREKCHPQFQRKPNKLDRSRSAGRKRKANASRASADKENDKGNAQVVLFQRVFFDVIVSKKFSLLCKLLCESFPGFRGDNLLDFSVINSRMIKGDYEQSPICYARDIQEVWRKLQKIGSEIVSLTKSLSDMSWTSYRNKVEGLVDGTCEEEKDEGIDQIHLGKKGCSNLVNGTRFPSQESDRYTKPEHTESFGINKFCTCSHCGEKADGKDCLVCDSCEEIYHVFCIEPPVEDIPPTNWFCANCSLSGIESPHENCVVCEKLNDPIILTREEEMVLVGVDMCSDRTLEEWSDCNMKNKEMLHPSNGNCKVCGSGEEDGQKFRICGHSLCPNKFYHIRCLTREQLKSHGPLWYCPSCLCRACLTDKDDDEIVLCDGCDHAYHIYCMRPPQTSIPSGKWFCGGCEVDIEVICKAREKHENVEKQTMDILISAAEKLKSEEKLGAGMKKR